ncbi:MAG: RtcB family protein [Ruminococcaceae bacterium]|nr:RtcB family protein [Oscillospiraceae bacterium]
MIEIKGAYTSAIVYADKIDAAVCGQLTALCNSPAMVGTQIRIMPDVHAGSWVIGTTVRFKDQIIPSIIGTDIGCGVLRVPFESKGKLDFEKLDKVIRDHIPSGRAIRQTPHRFSERVDLSSLKCAKHIRMEKALLSLGTLGGGNHFIEVAEGNYLLIHTGSRHLGAEVAKWYQDAAFAACNGDVSYQLARIDGELMNDYVQDVCILEAYAKQNRLAIADDICSAMRWKINARQAEDTPHNYICKEDEWFVLRKGAISARKHERPTIPMNMRDGSLICRGLSNEEWNCSAPHGAGRLYSRHEVKERFTLTQYKQAMKGIHSPSVDRKTLDECPMAYKPMEEIVSKISPTVEIEKIIRPLYNFKAGEED